MPWFPISEVRELVRPAIGTRWSLLTSGIADKTLPARDDNCLEPRMSAKLLEQMSDVIAHRLGRQLDTRRGHVTPFGSGMGRATLRHLSRGGHTGVDDRDRREERGGPGARRTGVARRGRSSPRVPECPRSARCCAASAYR